ncbi:MAG: iron-sulfur cluster assembly accessory protein [Planctomycetes bacterium]|nr:iron-sulfur cluster assembly accessory protein [Planctomycetota bacterium]
MISLTSKAIEKVKGFQRADPRYQEKPFRVYVTGGGCSGMSYGFKFDDRRDGDQVLCLDGLQVVVDPKSLEFVKGSQVDYHEGFEGSGFLVQNPNATGGCGCGQSFST